jgi:hypothetical protein
MLLLVHALPMAHRRTGPRPDLPVTVLLIVVQKHYEFL